MWPLGHKKSDVSDCFNQYMFLGPAVMLMQLSQMDQGYLQSKTGVIKKKRKNAASVVFKTRKEMKIFVFLPRNWYGEKKLLMAMTVIYGQRYSEAVQGQDQIQILKFICKRRMEIINIHNKQARHFTPNLCYDHFKGQIRVTQDLTIYLVVGFVNGHFPTIQWNFNLTGGAHVETFRLTFFNKLKLCCSDQSKVAIYEISEFAFFTVPIIHIVYSPIF